MDAKKICTMASIANMFLDAGNVKSYKAMKAKICREIYREQMRRSNDRT